MKPKLFLIQYGDKVLLAALAALVIWAIVVIVRTQNKVPASLGDDMKKQADQVKTRMDKSVAPPMSVPEGVTQVADLASALRIPPVVPPLSDKMLTGENRTRYLESSLLPGKAIVLEVPGVEIVGLAQPAPPSISAQYSYDRDKSLTIVTITAIEDTAGKTVKLLLKDRYDKEHEFPVIVFAKPPEVRPMPLRDVAAVFVLGKVVLTATVQPPPAIASSTTISPTGRVISKRPEFVEASGFKAYRKFKDAPDSQYRLVTPEAGVGVLTSPDFLKELSKLGLSPQAAAAPLPGALPELPGMVFGGAAVEEKKYCFFADGTVMPGETYDYKVVAVPVAGTGPEKRVEGAPTMLTVEVPPGVRFYVQKFFPGAVDVLVQRYFFDEMVRVEQRFNGLTPGDPIGAVMVRLRAIDLQTSGTKGTKEDVDMFTGACLVNLVDKVPKYTAKITFQRNVIPGAPVRLVDPRTGAVSWVPGKPQIKTDRLFALSAKPEPYIIYLDKKGNLDAKYLGLPQAESFRPKSVLGSGPGATPGVPGGSVPGTGSYGL